MEIFNVKEVAQYLNCSISKVYDMVRDNAIPCFRIGAKINFNRLAIDNWIKTQELESMKQYRYQDKIISIKEAIQNV